MSRWFAALLCASCASCASCNRCTSQPGPPPRPDPSAAAARRAPTGPGAIDIVIHNPTNTPAEVQRSLGPSTEIKLIDEAGSLAPLALYTPPHHCERACDDPPLNGCSPGDGPAVIPAGGSLVIPWGGAVRKPRWHDGQACYDRAPAPDGVYLLRVCTTSSRCGLARFTMPRTTPVEVTLGPRDDAPPPCEPGTARRALALALGAARLAGITDEQLAGCGALAPGCGGPPLDVEPGPCRARVSTGSGRLEVDLRPPPRDGAPLRFEVWVDADAVGTGNIFREGSRWAATADGELLVRGQPQHEMHEHGGSPASINGAQFRAYNRGDRPRTLSLRGASWLTSHGPPKPLAGASLTVEGKKPGAELVVPSRSSIAFWVTFPAQKAYQAWNDHFLVEAELSTDAGPLRPQAEIHVTRFDVVRP